MSPSTSAAPQAPTVYVVDDDDSVRRSVAVLVESMNYRCETFARGGEFLEKYDDSQLGVLVVDLRMPEMDGLELQQRLTEDGHSLPVIFITGFADVPVAVRAMAGGAVTLLEKPYDENELWLAIRKAIQLDRERREDRIRRSDASHRLSQLKPQEREVMRMVVEGKPNKVIASRLDVSLRTIEERRRQVFRKTGTNSVAELVRFVVALSDEAEQP